MGNNYGFENYWQVDTNPRGPLSTFSIAMRNIRGNLLAKIKTDPEGIPPEDIPNENLKIIRNEFLKTILTLTVPVTGDLKNFLEFPIAASWGKNLETGKDIGEEIFFSGLGSEDDNPEINKIKKALKKIVEKAQSELSNETGGEPTNLINGETDYPESLRKINPQKYWHFGVKGLKSELDFLVFYSVCAHENQEKATESLNERIDNIRDAFQNFFLDSGYNSVEFLIQAESLYEKLAKRGRLTQPTFLKDIISTIQDQITRLKRGPEPTRDSSDHEPRGDFGNAFRLVFVRPVIVCMESDEGKHEKKAELFFQYELSHQQIAYLEDEFASKKDTIIQSKERKVLNELAEELNKLAENRDGVFKTNLAPVQLSNIENDLKSLINDLKSDNIYKEDGAVEELLRKAIYTYYAFSDASKKELEQKFKSGLVEAIESSQGYVGETDAFLITQIFEMRRPDVVSNMVNHPLSKFKQRPTSELVNLFDDETPESSFYPRFLLLFENLFFPKRMFMYPMYQYGAPVMLCACDADYYAYVRQSLKSILDRYTEGVFTTIITDKRTEALRRLAEILKDTEDENTVRVAFVKELHKLVLFFSQSLKKAKAIEAVLEDIPVSRGTQIKKGDVKIKACSKGQDLEIIVADLSKLFRIRAENSEKFFTGSTSGRHTLELYLKDFAEIFCRIWENNKLIRGRLSSAVAHGVKTSLSPIATLSNVFKAKKKKFKEFIEIVSSYNTNHPETTFAQAYLDMADLDVEKLNSLSNVLSFYAEDAQKKVGLLYGGLKKERDKKEARLPVNNYIISGLVRAYCIALIRGDSNLVENLKVKKTLFRINDKDVFFKVPEIQAALEFSSRYEFSNDDGMEIRLNDLRFDGLAGATFGCIINISKGLPEWKGDLLTIAIEELTLNALKSLGLEAPLIIRSDDECLFGIENIAASRIPEMRNLRMDIGKEEMGGLHTAFYIVEDREYLNLHFQTKSEDLSQDPLRTKNVAGIYEEPYDE